MGVTKNCINLIRNPVPNWVQLRVLSTIISSEGYIFSEGTDPQTVCVQACRMVRSPGGDVNGRTYLG